MDTKNIKSTYSTYEEVKELLKDNNIVARLPYVLFVRKHPELNLVTNPQNRYKNDGWISWSDFFNRQTKTFKSIKESISVLRLNKVDSVEKYIEFRKENPQLNLYVYPNKTYKGKGWKSSKEFFGPKNKKEMREIKQKDYD